MGKVINEQELPIIFELFKEIYLPLNVDYLSLAAASSRNKQIFIPEYLMQSLPSFSPSSSENLTHLIN